MVSESDLRGAWYGEDAKIGFARKAVLPSTGLNNTWLEGKITNISRSGGGKETEVINCMGGVNLQYQKPQEEFEVSMDVVVSDTTFDEMLFGGDFVYIDTFASYADDAAIEAAWVPKAGDDASDITLDTTYYKGGPHGAKLVWGTYSSGTATYEMDFSNVHGANINLNAVTGATTGDPAKGRIEFWCYIPDANALAEFDSSTAFTVRFSKTDGGATNYDEWNFATSGLAVGWNKVIISMSASPDGTNGTNDWASIGYVGLEVTLDSAATGDDVTISEFRVYDPTITSADVSQLWRVTTLWQVNASSSVGEKLRWEFRNCSTVTWEPESASDEYLKGTITFKLPATDASGNANIKIEHTHDAAKQALVAQASW